MYVPDKSALCDRRKTHGECSYLHLYLASEIVSLIKGQGWVGEMVIVGTLAFPRSHERRDSRKVRRVFLTRSLLDCFALPTIV